MDQPPSMPRPGSAAGLKAMTWASGWFAATFVLKVEIIAESPFSASVRSAQSSKRMYRLPEPAELLDMTASTPGICRASSATASTTFTVWFMDVPSGMVTLAMNMPWSSLGTKVDGTSL